MDFFVLNIHIKHLLLQNLSVKVESKNINFRTLSHFNMVSRYSDIIIKLKKMKEFMMLFRTEKKNQVQPSPEEMQAMVKVWQDWIGGIAAQGKFVGTNALGLQGKTVHADGIITDGPYAEVKELVGGYIIVKADNLDEAVKLANGCPTLAIGGKVEVRDVMVFDN